MTPPGEGVYTPRDGASCPGCVEEDVAPPLCASVKPTLKVAEGAAVGVGLTTSRCASGANALDLQSDLRPCVSSSLGGPRRFPECL